MLDQLAESFDNLKSSFASLEETDINGAWALMKQASGLMETFDTYINRQNKRLTITNIRLESLESRYSLKASGSNVKAGDRKTNTIPLVRRLRVMREGLKEEHENLLVKRKAIERIYYCAKSCYEIANREYRKG